MTNPPTSNKLPFGKLWRFFTVFFAVLLIIFILRTISIDELVAAIQQTEITPLVIAFGLNIVVYILIGLRWRVLYNIASNPPSSIRLVKITFVSIFFNTILPSVVGGDAYRAFELKNHSDAPDALEHSFAIVFLDRIIGLVGLMVFGCIGILLYSSGVSLEFAIVTVLVLIGLIAILNFSMTKRTYTLLLKLLQWMPATYLSHVESILERLYQNLSVFKSHTHLIIQAIGISLLLRFLWFVAGYYVGVSLALDLPLFIFIAFMPIIEIVRMIPLTVQGIGVREGLFILLFGTVGVSNTDAVLLATLIYLMATIIGVFGGAIYLLERLFKLLRQQ